MHVERSSAILVAALLLLPVIVSAFPFGGQTQVHHYCYNAAIYALLGPPRGGPYIWTPSTRTYQFGPPSGVGQWLLGLTGPPYYCVVTRSPIFVKEGMSIMMMGSSGPAAPAHRPAPAGGGLTLPPPSGSGGSGGGGGGNGGGGGLGTGKIVISEVYGAVAQTHGGDPLHEWVEIYNGTGSTADLSGWTLSDAQASRAIPAGTTVSAGSYVLLAATSTTRGFWPSIPSSVRLISLNALIGDGLLGEGDQVALRQGSVTIDAVSWGANRDAFSPAAVPLSAGESLTRRSVTQDTDTSQDWANQTPSPGR